MSEDRWRISTDKRQRSYRVVEQVGSGERFRVDAIDAPHLLALLNRLEVLRTHVEALAAALEGLKGTAFSAEREGRIELCTDPYCTAARAALSAYQDFKKGEPRGEMPQ